MAKWFGKIGFAELKESKPGVWTEEITEREYFGEVRQYSRRLQQTAQVIDDVTVASEISIISDPFADQHFHSIRYIEFMSTKWKVTLVTPQYPRLIMTLGGLYNGN